MNQPIKQEFETHEPAAMTILFYYLSKIFTRHNVAILGAAKPTITEADMEIVEKALNDREARSAILSKASENKALLDRMGTYFNHMLYTDRLSKIAYAAEIISSSTERLVQSGKEHSRRFEEDARGLLKTEEDGKISLALPHDGAVLAESALKMQRNIQNYSNKYSETSKTVNDLLVAALHSSTELAKALHIKLEQ